MSTPSQQQLSSDGGIGLNAPDSGMSTAAWAFEEAVVPKVAALATLAVELNRDMKQMIIRPDADSSFSILNQKIAKHAGKTVNIEPRAFGAECESIALTFIKGGEERKVEALRLKVEVAPDALILKSVIARVGDRDVEVFNSSRLPRKD